MTDLENRIRAIEERNSKVEAEKAWETSKYRVISITLLTYLVATFVMWGIHVDRPYWNALIPTIGFYLSTQSIPILKKNWIKKRFHK